MTFVSATLNYFLNLFRPSPCLYLSMKCYSSPHVAYQFRHPSFILVFIYSANIYGKPIIQQGLGYRVYAVSVLMGMSLVA